MTMALCTGCGSMKFGAWLPCKSCGVGSTGMKDLDIFMSDHYLGESGLAFLSRVVKSIGAVVRNPGGVQQLFMYYAVQRLPGLGQINIEPAQKAEIERILHMAEPPPIPGDLIFRFDKTLKDRAAPSKSWWKPW